MNQTSFNEESLEKVAAAGELVTSDEKVTVRCIHCGYSVTGYKYGVPSRCPDCNMLLVKI